jgi:DNA-binding transcriptional LysR family regulator
MAININSVDLNLFLVFQAIYTTGSVTQAGEQLFMTQSAVSNALKRLRERFDDPLFVRTPKGMVPTPVAAQLIQLVEEGLAKFKQALDQVRRFDAGTSDHLFRIAINDIGQMVIMPLLLASARASAPSVRFETLGASVEEARQMLVEGRIDLAVGSWGSMGNGFHEQRLFTETFVALLNIDHEIQSTQMSFEQYFAAEHLAYRPSGASDAALQATLLEADMLARRKVVFTAAHTLGLSSILASSSLVLTVPLRLGQALMSARSGLRIVQLPFAVRPFSVRQQWHDRNHADGANLWLRGQILNLFQGKSVQEAPMDAL